MDIEMGEMYFLLVSKLNMLPLCCYSSSLYPTRYLPQLNLSIRNSRATGFTPDIIVWQVKFDKSGGYGGFSKAFDLCGHNAGIHYFDFANQAKRFAVLCHPLPFNT